MHRKLNLKQRIGLCFAAFFAALAAQIVLSFYQSNTVLRQLDEQMGNFNAISRFQNGVERSLSAMEDYRWEYGDGEALLTELQGSFSVMNAWLWRIDGDLHTVSQEQYLLYRAVSTTYEHYNVLVGQLETALRAGGETEAAQLYYNKVAPCGGYLRQYTQQLLNTAITDGQEEYTAVSALSDRVKWLQTVVGVLCLALGSLMALEVTRMLNPVQRMIEASRKVTEGRYDAPDLPVPRQDEMGRLAEAFIQMEWKISDSLDLTETMVPSFILQPIVENAFKHGISPKEEGGRVRIRINPLRDKGLLYISVCDNGVGIEKAQLEQLKTALAQPGERWEHIGVYNVAARLRLLDERGRLEICSHPGRGTAIRLYLPLIEPLEEEELDDDPSVDR